MNFARLGISLAIWLNVSVLAVQADRGTVGELELDMLPGVVEAWQTVDLSFAAPGIVGQVVVKEMQKVYEGELLVVLDDRVAKASLAAAAAVSQREAALTRASLAVALAEKYARRVRHAFEKDAASALELDEAEGRLEEAKAGLSQVKEQQREAAALEALERVRLRSHELRAPFTGTVMRITARPGGSARLGEPLLRLTNLSQLRVVVHLPTQYFAQLSIGDAYKLHAEPPAPKIVEAQLIAQEPVIDAATGTFRCLFEIDNSDLSLPAGFVVRFREPEPTSSSNDY